MRYLLVILFLILTYIETRSQDFKEGHFLLKETLKKTGPSYRGMYFDYKLTLDSASNQFVFQSQQFDDNFNFSISNYFNKRNDNKQYLAVDVYGEGKFDELSGEPFFFMEEYLPYSSISWDDFYSPHYPYGGYSSIINKWYIFLDGEYKSNRFPWENFLVDAYVDFDINEKGYLSSNDQLGLLFLENNKIRFSPGTDDYGYTKSVLRLRIPKYNPDVARVTLYSEFYGVRSFRLGISNDLVKNTLTLDSLGDNVFYTRQLDEIDKRYTVVSVLRDHKNKYVLPMIHRGNIQIATNLIDKLLHLDQGKHSGGSYGGAFDRIYFYTENLK